MPIWPADLPQQIERPGYREGSSGAATLAVRHGRQSSAHIDRHTQAVAGQYVALTGAMAPAIDLP